MNYLSAKLQYVTRFVYAGVLNDCARIKCDPSINQESSGMRLLARILPCVVFMVSMTTLLGCGGNSVVEGPGEPVPVLDPKTDSTMQPTN